jgi:hypothetical protein
VEQGRLLFKLGTKIEFCHPGIAASLYTSMLDGAIVLKLKMSLVNAFISVGVAVKVV